MGFRYIASILASRRNIVEQHDLWKRQCGVPAAGPCRANPMSADERRLEREQPVSSGLPLHPEPIVKVGSPGSTKEDFKRWWDEVTKESPGIELVDRLAYRAWCAALGFDLDGEILVKRGDRATDGATHVERRKTQ